MSKVTVFQPYSFEVGEKVYIAGGPRRGDWLVTACEEKKLTLQCPLSKKEFTWDRFCYHVETCEQDWPSGE